MATSTQVDGDLRTPIAGLSPRPESAEPSGLTITDVRIVRLRKVRDIGVLEPAWKPGGQMRFRVGGGNYVEVHTAQGLVGIGPQMDPSLVPPIRDMLVGRDPFDTEAHASMMRRLPVPSPRRGSASIDIALWDLIGKASGQPLHRLWGGTSDSVAAYASTVRLSTEASTPELAIDLLESGWRAIKLRTRHATMVEDVRVAEAVRMAVGERMEIIVDANQVTAATNDRAGAVWDLARAAETARELQALGCTWLEEPLPRSAFGQLAELRDRVDLPIAGGERTSDVDGFRLMLEQGLYDVVQPDCLVGLGITGLREIGTLAAAFGAQVAPHHGGGCLGTVAHMHLVAAWSHSPCVELIHDPPIGSYEHRFAILKDPPVVGPDGRVKLPQAPGLGVEIDPDMVE